MADSITATIVDQWSDGKRLHVIGSLAFSGNYTEGGLVLDLSAIEAAGPPIFFDAPTYYGYQFRYIPAGQDLSKGRLKVLQLAALPATGTMTSDATNVSAGDTVTVGATTYTFRATVATTANEVLVGVSAADSLLNLSYAINNDPAQSGIKFGSATVANLTEFAAAPTATVLTVIARKGGTGGNSDALSTTAAHLTASGANLAGGAALSTTAAGELVTASAFPADLLVLTPQFHAVFYQLGQLV